MKKSIIYIAGYGRSGSTLLERLLASNAEVIATGESCNLRRVLVNAENCSCNQSTDHCPQWKDFFREFKNEFDEYEKSRSRYESNWGFLFRSSHHRKQLVRYFEFLMRQTGKHIIDSSKTTRRSAFRPFLLAKAFDVKMIHLVKDGRDCLASNLKGSNRKLGRSEEVATYRFAFTKTVFAWSTANLVAELFGVFRRSKYLRIRYEDLSENAESTLNRIGDFLEVDLGKSLDIVSQDLEIPVAHQLAGNRMSKEVGIKLLRRTRAAKSPTFHSRAFSFFTCLLMWRYGYFQNPKKIARHGNTTD